MYPISFLLALAGVSGQMDATIDNTVIVTDAVVNVTDADVGTTNTSSTATTIMSTTTTESTTTTMAFDPMTMFLQLNVDHCIIADLSPNDAFEIVHGVNDMVMEECGLNSTIADISDGDGICTLLLKVESNDGPTLLKDCFSENREFEYMGVSHQLSLPVEPVTSHVPSPLTNGDLRKRLESGLDSDLLDDDAVVTILLDRNYADIPASIDDLLTYINDLMERLEELVTPPGSPVSRSVEMVGFQEEPESGKIEITVRPISTNADAELETLTSLQDLVEDPNSALNMMDGIVHATTTTTTTTTTSTTTSSSTNDGDGTNWPLVGGLIGGVAGLALLGGGAAYVTVKKKKNDKKELLVPQDANGTNEPVYTPGTKHGVEGILTDRTPRVTGANSARHQPGFD